MIDHPLPRFDLSEDSTLKRITIVNFVRLRAGSSDLFVFDLDTLSGGPFFHENLNRKWRREFLNLFHLSTLSPQVRQTSEPILCNS